MSVLSRAMVNIFRLPLHRSLRRHTATIICLIWPFVSPNTTGKITRATQHLNTERLYPNSGSVPFTAKLTERMLYSSRCLANTIFLFNFDYTTRIYDINYALTTLTLCLYVSNGFFVLR